MNLCINIDLWKNNFSLRLGVALAYVYKDEQLEAQGQMNSMQNSTKPSKQNKYQKLSNYSTK